VMAAGARLNLLSTFSWSVFNWVITEETMCQWAVPIKNQYSLRPEKDVSTLSRFVCIYTLTCV
jgi:hypothetical protein